jgi:type II secretory ATPase GspE/PulE/Tfp pilus assembly ATPase PilB-like protein
MTAVVKWVKLVGDQEQASKQLKGVVAMRLLRKVCTNCRVAYQPPPDMLKKLNLPADKVQQLVKKGGQVLIKNKPEVCPVCQGTGYLGQEGVFEVFVFDDACREAIRSGNINALRAELRKKQFPTIAQAAMQKLVTLTTTVDEVIRITAEAAPPAAQPAPAAPKPA